MNNNQSDTEQIYDQVSNQPEQQPEQIDFVKQIIPMTLIKKPDQFKQAFFKLIDVAAQAIKSRDYDRSILALNKCVDMLDLGKNILKQINPFWKLVIYGNLACSYHFTRKLAKCNKFCQKLKEELELILSKPIQKQLFLKLNKMLIKLKFQHCAILSQLQYHEKAFQLCKSTGPMLITWIDMLLDYIKVNSAQEEQEQTATQMVQFKRRVYTFAQTILNDLLKCLNQPLKSREHNSFYFWQKNPEINEQQVKKRYIPNTPDNSCKRSILGVSKSTHWIDQFNIGSIMHFAQININQLQNRVPIEEYLFKDKLYELVIYCSLANFTMATQLRLIESARIEQAQRQDPEETRIPGLVNLMKKYGYEQKSEIFKLSEIYHLRAIQIMAHNIKVAVPYITHIIRSYQGHYIKQKQVLDPIVAIVQESSISVNQSRGLKHSSEKIYQNAYEDYKHKTDQKVFDISRQDFNQDLLMQSKSIKQSNSFHSHVFQLPENKANILNSFQNTQHEKVQQLKTVKSDSNISKIIIAQIPKKEQLNNSDQYLKSNQVQPKRKMKVSIVRSKSKNKVTITKLTGTVTGKEARKQGKMFQKKAAQTQHTAHEKLKTERHRSKTKQKQRLHNMIKKQKFLDLDQDKYGQREIKIKTQSCTHIKVVYKKKKQQKRQ